MRDRVLDGGDEDRVVATFVAGDDSALEVRGGTDEERRSALATLDLEIVEAVGVWIRESPRVRLLVLGEHADANPFL